ncbi:MAG: hypothetical protein E7642_04800 [Ruminococcaceae bacterium]|nr:hypothetical protein [Oscillospiraceae bacterium]
MGGNKNKNSELLLDAIGEIDDRFIFEAESYVPGAKKLSLRKYLVAAFSVVLIMSLSLSLLVGMLTREDKKETADEGIVDVPDENEEKPTDRPATNAPTERVEPEVNTLSQTLEQMKEETANFASPLEREMLFDGDAKLIWKYEDEENYRICTLSRKNSTTVERALTNKKGFVKITESDVSEDDGIEGVWICFGDGYVFSPYLENSNGNVGYGTLFDYERELEPSEDFAQLIERIVSNK